MYIETLYHLSSQNITVLLLQPTPPDFFVRQRNRAGSSVVPQQRQTIGIYLALQPVRRTAGCVTIAAGALLPHLFTRSPNRHVGSRWLFSVTLLSPFKDLPVKKHGALRCPDFPPRCASGR